MSEDIVYSGDELPAISDTGLLALADQAEKRVAAINRIKRAAMSVTNPRDWTNQGGKPYLQVSGAEKIARVFGISWQIDEPMVESLEGGHFSFTYKGKFGLAGATIEAVGTRSSKDPFFSTKSQWVNGEKQKQDIPGADVDRGDVKKAAYTNCIGNGITRLLGIRNMTWEDLKDANITLDTVAGVEYKKAGKSEAPPTTEGATDLLTTVVNVTKKEGTSNGKPYTKYTVEAPEGRYNTFSETLAKLAVEAKTNNLSVALTYKTTKFGNDLERLSIFPREPGDDTAKESEA